MHPIARQFGYALSRVTPYRSIMSPEPLAILLARVGFGVHLALHRRLDRRRLTVIQHRILQLLAAEDARHFRQVARDLRLRRQTVVAASLGLAARGLIIRGARPGDARVVPLSITDEGRRVLHQLQLGIDRLERLLTVRLSPRQAGNVARALRLMDESLLIRPQFEVTGSE